LMLALDENACQRHLDRAQQIAVKRGWPYVVIAIGRAAVQIPTPPKD